MPHHMSDNNHFNIGIICGKLADVDGVSLEVNKWITVLQAAGHNVFTIAGRYGSPMDGVPAARQLTLNRIDFNSPFQCHWEKLVFPNISRHPPLFDDELQTEFIHHLESESNDVANILFEYIQNNSIDVILGENTNAMPMTLVAGMAVHKLAEEKRMAAIFHHHDFWWERSRFSNSHIEPLLSDIMPPSFPGLEHLVISSYAAHVLGCLKRIRAKVVPNCENFDDPPVNDDYNMDFRRDMGFKDDDILIVQPTRIVRRKKIEDAIELVGRLVQSYPDIRDRVKFVISLYQGDEPDENYVDQIQELAGKRDIALHRISHRVASKRMLNSEGQKMYTNRDVLVNADLATYLPIWEGFGNALLEAIAARVPVVVSEYLVYKTDIRVAGLRTIEIRDRYTPDGMLMIPDSVVERIYHVLTHPDDRQAMVDWNFQAANDEFGMHKLTAKLNAAIDDYGDEIRASRKRIHNSKTFYHV